VQVFFQQVVGVCSKINALGVAVSARQLPPNPFLAVADGLMQTLSPDEFVLWHPTPAGQSFAADLPSVRLPHGHRNPQYGPNNPIWTVGPDGNVALYVSPPDWSNL